VFFNRIVASIIVVLSMTVSTLFATSNLSAQEDTLIVSALLYEEYKSYDNAYFVYKKLFDETHAEVYLFREATSALMARKYIYESINRLKIWDAKHPNEMAVRRLLIPLYLTVHQVDNATKEAEFLLEQSHSSADLDLASNSFLYAGKYKRALKLLEKMYAESPQENVLLRMIALMDEFTNERKKAIQLLETYRRMNNNVSFKLYIALLQMYQKEKDIDGMLDIYKAIYKQDKNDTYLSKIIDAYVYKRDIDGAIEFLEKEHIKDELLYQLYRTKKDFSKAITLVDTLYEKDKDPKWIAEKGILMFEIAKDKNDKTMIKDVLSKFEKAMALGNDDSVYLNYYGYTLIDKDINIQKGMKIIQDALLQQPNNTYYLDSLAWGYYKQGKCTKAYALMKQVVDEEGLAEQEIINHWQHIKQCK